MHRRQILLSLWDVAALKVDNRFGQPFLYGSLALCFAFFWGYVICALFSSGVLYV